jgi:RNA polymerase sigma factor (TIGR02999 family)
MNEPESHQERGTASPPSGDITKLLERWSDGDETAFQELVPIVYKELRRIAGRFLQNERPGHTLQPTALVHEAYLRLRGTRKMRLTSRAHFYGAAAQVMRRVLVDYARSRKAQKRGSGELRSMPTLDVVVEHPGDLIELDEALGALEAIAPKQARVVELRFFGGLSVHETAEYLGASPATVKRYWSFSRAWLYRHVTDSRDGQRGSVPT